MIFKRVVAPLVEPISLTEVKDYLRIDGNDSDSTLSPLIISAREYCEDYQNRALITQTWELTLDSFPDNLIRVPRPPLQSVVSIKYKDELGIEATISSSDYIVDTDSEPGRIVLAAGKTWPSLTLQPINGVKIRYVAGYGDNAADVPQKTKDAMLMYIANRHENPEEKDVPRAVHSLLYQDRVIPL